VISGALLEILRNAQSYGLIGRAPLDEHVLHARSFLLAAADLLPPEPRILDLGSGAGVPGLVLAELLPAATVVLVESRLLRAVRLREAVEQLDLTGRVQVADQRAETAGRDPEHRGQFDLVTARSFARPPITAECAAPFLRVGGVLVVSEPPDPAESLRRWPELGLQLLGLRVVRRLEDPRSFVVLQLTRPCPEAYPRRTGIPEKRPLF